MSIETGGEKNSLRAHSNNDYRKDLPAHTDPDRSDGENNGLESLLAGDTLHTDPSDARVMISSAVAKTDDVSQPSLTFRVLFLGTLFSCALAFVNMYYWFRSNPITLGIPVVQLLSLPAGWIMSQVLPKRTFNTFGLRWSLNPGPFSVKEHVLISIFANASTGTTYALDIIVARKFWIGPPLTFGAGVLLALTSQLIGYSFSGIFHRFLVVPDAMVWPSTLVNVTLFRTLQSMIPAKGADIAVSDTSNKAQTDRPQNSKSASSRLKLFWAAFALSFAWYFVPGWFFPTLTMLPILCFIAPNNIYANQLGDGYGGLGMLALTLDWSTISNVYTGSPLATPWFAACNLFVGFVLVMWVITPIAYYSNAWDAKSLPIYTNTLFASDGSEYNVSRVLRDGKLDPAAYESYSPMRMSFQFLLMYGFCFMGITCLLSHVVLNHGPDLWRSIRSIRKPTIERTSAQTDHYSESIYPKVPWFWYASIAIATLAMGLASCQVYHLLPWYGFLLAIGLAGLLTLPVGLVEAVSNFQYALGVITELIAGYIWPGQPTYNASFKMFGYITMKQSLMLTKDQKLGRYMRIPPRHLFICQVLGTVIAVFVQLGTSFWLMNTVDNICTDDGFPFTCRQGRLFYSTMVIWGVIGPQRQFGGQYGALYWMFLVGVFLPLPFWLLRKRYPRSIWRHVNIPVALTYIGYMPNAPTHDFVMFTLFCFVFNYVLMKYRSVWWQKYNFTLTAALDSGLAVSGIIGYFALQHVHVSWWGTKNHCPLSKQPFAASSNSS
ncbi:hypothetical protein LPJ53_004726 [Coemansia erecta]|uniref:OPT superfamily oligopeptide transporter n=1 Tax=Coemansia erecta TaxID=147472 RepID=A0A9W7XX55_9FUNG|nr:hypothetical protein LPJ53_004726 [Coemansia erecta]